jgi:AraC-like DNA-binding protein
MVDGEARPALNKRDMIRPKDEPPRGILNVPAAQAVSGHARYHPSDDLAPFVEHYWTVAWDLRETQTAETLPHPSVHIVLEAGKGEVHGVSSRRFSRVLEGKGRVFGIKFRPGGFRPFVTRPVADFTDRGFPLQEIFGAAAARLAQRALAPAEHAETVAILETFLRQCNPQTDPSVALAARIAERIAADRTINRVEQIVAEFSIGLRTLQRLFGEYVGVSPKWVIQRYRLHEAAARLAAGGEMDWADIALELGYADQAHFIRDFRKLVGRSPADYVKALGKA